MVSWLSGFLVVAPDSIWQRMATIVSTSDKNPWVETTVEHSKHERLVLWGLAIKIWEQHPYMGIGPTNYTKISAVETDFIDPYEGKRGLQAHNTWLQLLAEYGTVGAVVWAGSFFFSFFCYRRARKKMTGYPGWEWFPAFCLGLEAGTVGCALVLSFNSFQWYDYIYWHMVFGPVTLQIAKETSKRLDWLKPSRTVDPPSNEFGDDPSTRHPPRYGPPKRDGLTISNIDLSDTNPMSS